MSVAATTNMGRLATLTALRDRLAADIDVCTSDRNLPALAMRLTDVLEQIDELAPPVVAVAVKETGLSDFEKRLRAREQQTAGSRRSKSG